MGFKSKNIFLISFLAIAGIFGVSSAVINKQIEEAQVAEKAFAGQSGSSGQTVFFVPSGQWISSGDMFKVAFSNTSDGVNGAYRYDCVEVDLKIGKVLDINASTKLFYADVPYDCDYMRFWRYDSSGKYEHNSSSVFKMSETGYEGNGSCIYMDFSLDYWNNWYPGLSSGGYSVTWKKLTTTKKVKASEQSASSSTGRVFLNNSGCDWAGWGSPGVLVTGSNGYTTTIGNFTFEGTVYYMNTFQDDNGTYYEYADIPLDITGLKFCNCGGSNYDSVMYNTQYQIKWSESSYSTDAFTLTGGFFEKVYYGSGKSGESQYVTISMGAPAGGTGFNILSKMLETINTCSDSTLNGYKVYDTLNANITGSLSSSIREMTTHTYNDENTYTIDTILTALEARNRTNNANANYASYFNLFGRSGDDNSLSTVIIIVASSLALLSVTALSILVLKKRKSKEQE